MPQSRGSLSAEAEPVDVDFRVLVEANWTLREAQDKLDLLEHSAVGAVPADEEPSERAARVARERREREETLREATSKRDGARSVFAQVKAVFEASKGPIVDYYFTRTVKQAGIALTFAAPSSLQVSAREWILDSKRRRDSGGSQRFHTHNLVLVDLPDDKELVSLRVAFAELLHQIDGKQVQTQYMLRGLSRRVLMRRLFALRRDMLAELDGTREQLGFGSRSGATPISTAAMDFDTLAADAPSEREVAEEESRHRAATKLVRALKGYTKEFESIETTYGEAATREARMIYIRGMITGLLWMAAISAVLGVLFHFVKLPIETKTFFTCVVAGAVGALVSVLQRMSAGKFTVNHEVGREYVAKLAGFRPFIGSIFGLAAYFAITGGIAHITPPVIPDRRYAFYAFIAFLAGFSERFAKELLGTTSEGSEGKEIPPGATAEQLSKLVGGPNGGDGRVVEIETTHASSRPASPDGEGA